jgi:hypothetical protein
VAVVLLFGGLLLSLYTDLLWFQSTGYTEVFSTVLLTRVLLFLSFGLLMALFIGINVAVAYRVRPPFRPMSLEQQNLERYRVSLEPYRRTGPAGRAGVFGCSRGCPRPAAGRPGCCGATARSSASRTRSSGATSPTSPSPTRSSGSCWASCSPR